MGNIWFHNSGKWRGPGIWRRALHEGFGIGRRSWNPNYEIISIYVESYI
jgi:hypothetical protein